MSTAMFTTHGCRARKRAVGLRTPFSGQRFSPFRPLPGPDLGGPFDLPRGQANRRRLGAIQGESASAASAHDGRMAPRGSGRRARAAVYLEKPVGRWIVPDGREWPARGHESVRDGTLARGHQPEKGPYGAQIARAIDYVLSIQDPEVGSIFPERFVNGRAPYSFSGNYNHGISALMLAEVYGMTNANRRERIRGVITKALKYTRAATATEAQSG